MKRFLVLSTVLLLAATFAFAAGPGESCATAIPMGKDYVAQVKKGQTIWYSAWTFDLPLTVTFAPSNGKNDPAPIVEMDFSCTPGYYEDSILCSLFCKNGGGAVSIDLPHKPSLNSKTLDDGTFIYYLSLGKQYRDLLLQVGISYNVEVFVKVTYQSSGKITLAPDDLFGNCVDGAKFMHVNDTVQVAKKDKQRHVIVPYVQWQEDTILYKWTGTTPCTMAVANTCDFDPTDNTDGNIIQFVPDIQPGDSVKTLATYIYKWVHNPEFPNEAGMYFAKFYSEEKGVMQITKAPRAKVRGNATILRHGDTYSLQSNDTAVFAITRLWDDDTLHTFFSTPTMHLFSMMIATDPDFAEEHALRLYQFEKAPDGHHQGVLGTEINKFFKQTSEQFLYVKFICSEATSVSVLQWRRSSCFAKTSNFIHSLDTTFEVKRNNTGGVYRFNYAQWVGGDMTLTLTPKAACQLFFATDCDISLSSTAENLLHYHKLTSSSNTVTIPAETIASWAERIDEEGCMYARFNHTSSGKFNMHLVSTAPKDTDPTYPATTIVVLCEGSKIVVNVSEAQSIVVIDEAGTEKAKWDAEPGTPHELNLPPGNYSLAGEREKISLKL